MQGLNWFWIALEVVLPPPLALLLAFLFWRKGQTIVGNIVGTGVLFGTAFALIFREHAELDILIRRCFDEGTVCWPEPSAFTRFAIYAFIVIWAASGGVMLPAPEYWFPPATPSAPGVPT